MTYYLDLFSPDTYEAFGRSDRTLSGFRQRQRNLASRIKTGDKLICYMTKLSRWIGVLEVESGPFTDSTPIFYSEGDPFTLRFRVQANIWLPLEKTVPIHDQEVWAALSFTRDLPEGSIAWTGKVRSSLGRLSDEDGRFLEELLSRQATSGKDYPVEPELYRRLLGQKVRRTGKEVPVSIPEDREHDQELVPEATASIRDSHKIQALLAEIGSRMGMHIWIPKADRNAVLHEWRDQNASLLDKLPLNYDDITLRTIEQIDVLWLKGRSIKRAFEVEHTTSVYSGLLRMADLLSLQPNMDIRLHIVAPDARREKVFQEIRRPVFSLLERGPLSESCTFISYDSVRKLGQEQHLEYLADSVLDEYEEEAEDT